MRDTLKKIKDDAKKVALGESKSKIYSIPAPSQTSLFEEIHDINKNNLKATEISPELLTMM